jgi:hypothetical protein
MKPLILTCWPLQDFIESGTADLAISVYFRFVWGQLPSTDELSAYLGPRTPDHGPSRGRHWSDFAYSWGRSQNKRQRDLGLAEFCERYETVELSTQLRKRN